MSKFEIEFPFLCEDVEEQKEKLTKEFYDKVIVPFNEFFKDYTVEINGRTRELCELDQECSEPWEGEIAWGQVFSPFNIERIEENTSEIAVFLYFNGTAKIDLRTHQKTGTWEEAIREMFCLVKTHLEQLHDTERIEKLVQVMEILNGKYILERITEPIYEVEISDPAGYSPPFIGFMKLEKPQTSD